MLIEEKELSMDFWTQAYRALNPFVDDNGRVGFDPGTMTTQLINFNLNESPIWRDYGGLIAIGAGTLLTAGILGYIASIGAVAGGAATGASTFLGTVAFNGYVGGATMTYGTLIAGAGGTIASALTAKGMNDYSINLAKKTQSEKDKQIADDLAKLNQLKSDSENLNDADLKAIADAEAKLKEQSSQYTAGATIKKLIPIAIAGIGAYFMFKG